MNLTPEEEAFWSKFTYVHDPELCTIRDAPCVVHRPTDHHMRTWRMVWRADRGIVERVCEHGVGHPDPDQFAYWERAGEPWQGVHGCCGCCRAEPWQPELPLGV